ncbi:MAG: cation-translocating P-type ATPase [Deltaproteobacteria bacterium]|nr:cation-translocating P-type ATPase [Deltaproteobacteria bacterium]
MTNGGPVAAKSHQQSVEESLAGLRTTRQGLSAAEALARQAQHGPNELAEGKRRTALRMFLGQFKDFMIVVLLAAAVIAGALGEMADTIAIAVIVVLNAALGFVQEYRAEKAMAALRKMAATPATVVRGGVPGVIPAAGLVPGDIVLLEAGNVVPADLRLTEALKLRVEEAALTGESVPVEKQTDALADEGLSVGDRTNLAYRGTLVTYGRGTGVVIATGMKTELGRIATMLQEGEETKTPLQKRLVVFGKKLALAVLAICALVFVVGLLRNEPPLQMLLTAISLAVAAIPEALPAVITISLALGAKKMVRQNALVRKLPAVETLGSVTYICSDKTGTLTLNRMSVEEVYADRRWIPEAELSRDQAAAPGGTTRGLPLPTLLTALALSNDARQEAAGAVVGDPTETALFAQAAAGGFSKPALELRHPRLAELPFDSERKLMTTFHAWEEGKVVSFTKGAVEVVLERADRVLTAQGESELVRSEVLGAAEKSAAEGLRVLGIGMRVWDRLPEDTATEQVETGLTLLGLVGLLDPPRQEAKESVQTCRTAGIVPVMITGDHPLTARAIARRISILDDDHPAEQVITGRELEQLSSEEFGRRVEHLRVYARVAPEQKLKIVKALQDRGQFVAMTGDGVNDAPALRRADIGVAMGITGTDVSKEASHMILLDDNFATIVKAVAEGRRIFDNIRKFIKYTMTSNSGEIWTIFLAPFFGLPIPLLPIHILWINLVTDGLPGLALAAEPGEKGLMERPPRQPKESIFAHGLGTHIVWVGLLMGAVSIVTQAWSIRAGLAHWQTMVFTVLCLSQMGHVLAIRSERESLFRQGLFSNRPILGAFLLTLALQLATIYVPLLNPIFKTQPLTLGELAATLALSSVVFLGVEIEKLFRRALSSRPTRRAR